MRRVGLVWLCGVSILAMAVMGVGNAVAADSTTTTGGSSTSGTSTNGNAAAAKIVQNDPLAGAAGSGLTRGVTSSSVKVGCYLTEQAFTGADDGFKARFERANNNKELPGGRTIDFSACQDDGNNPQTNLQIVQKLVQQDGDFAIVGISPNVLTASTDFVAQQPGADVRLGHPAGRVRQPLVLRLQRLPGDELPGQEAHGVPGQPRPGADRGDRADAGAVQVRAAGAGQRHRACRQRDHQPAHQAGGREGRLQGGQHPGLERRCELHAVRAGDQGGEPEHPADADRLPDRARSHRGDDRGWLHRGQRQLRRVHPGPARHVGTAGVGLQRCLREQPDGAVRREHALHQADAEGPDRGERQDRAASSRWPTRSPTRRPTCWSRSSRRSGRPSTRRPSTRRSTTGITRTSRRPPGVRARWSTRPCTSSRPTALRC